MRRGTPSLLLVLLSAAGIAAAAVLLTPPVYRWLLDAGAIDADEFLKVLRRLLLFPLLIALFAWLKPWRDGGPWSYGLLGASARPSLFIRAWTVTAALLLSLLAWHWLVGWLAWEDPLDAGKALGRLGRWLGVGLVLAVLEEWFFRGWLERRLLKKAFEPVSAALLVALLYAAIHAFKPSRLDVEVTLDAAGALRALGWWFTHLVDPVAFGPTFAGLFLFSLVLTAAWRRWKTLWVPIGIHAAGITVLRSYGAFTDRDPQRTWAGTKELLDGPPAWLLLVAALLLITRGGAPRPESGDAGSSR
jgi:membrane protease YdiL (CAAX protease family)